MNEDDKLTAIRIELDQITNYLLTKYDAEYEALVSSYLDAAFDLAILDCGSGLGAIVGFQHAVATLAEESMEKEMEIFKMRVN